MKMVLMLIRAHLFERPLRAILSAFATACATCLIIWIVSGYASAIKSLDLYASRALGQYALIIDPVSRTATREVSIDTVKLLREDKRVYTADPMWAELLNLVPTTGADPDRSYEKITIATEAAQPPFKLASGRWIDNDTSDTLEIVLTADFATDLHTDVGQTLRIAGTLADSPIITIVGIVADAPKPVSGVTMGSRTLPTPSVASAFISLRDARKIHRRSEKITFVGVQLAKDVDVGSRPFSEDQVRSIAGVSGGGTQNCVPIVVEQPRLRDDITRSAEFPSVTRQNVVVVVGIDPARAFGGEEPLLHAEWVAGSPSEAISMMKTQRGCIVPDHFLRDTGYSVGQKFWMVPPEDPAHPVEYAIAGAIRMSGSHWLSKMSRMRSRTHRTAALILADYTTVAADFSLPGPRHIWLRSTTSALDAASLKDAISKVYTPSTGTGINGVENSSIDVISTEEVRTTVRATARFWLWVMSVLPLIAMAISSIGVLNIMLAAVQARRWEFGVLRAIGFTRATLIRLIIAEGVLIGVVACILGCLFGVLVGWSGTGLATVVSWFGGLYPTLVVPLTAVIAGCLILLGFAALSSVWPAWRVARMTPLKLLQQGRS